MFFMTGVDVKNLIKILEDLDKEVIDLKIGSGNKEYDVVDILASPISDKVVFCTESYVNYKKKTNKLI